MPNKTLTSLLAAVVALGAATVAVAAPADERVSIRVPIADLNLQNEAGARVALRRITNAASAICGDEADTRVLQRRMLFETCRRDVVDAAVAAAHSPVLAALNGRPARDATLAAAN